MESTEAIDLDLQKLWLIIKRWLPAVGMFSCVGIAVVVASTKASIWSARKAFVQEDKWDFFLYRFRPKIGELDGIAEKVTLSIQSLRLFDQFLCSKDYNRTQPKEWTGCPLKPEILAKQIELKKSADNGCYAAFLWKYQSWKLQR